MLNWVEGYERSGCGDLGNPVGQTIGSTSDEIMTRGVERSGITDEKPIEVSN